MSDASARNDGREPRPVRVLGYWAAAAVAAAAIVGAFTDIRKDIAELFADGDETPAAAAAAPAGRISVAEQVFPNVSLEAFYDDHLERLPPEGLSAAALARNGVVFSVDGSVNGVPGAACVLRWRLLDGDNRQLLAGPALSGQRRIEAAGGVCAVREPIWTPVAEGVDSMVLEVRLLDEAGKRLVQPAESARLAVAGEG